MSLRFRFLLLSCLFLTMMLGIGWLAFTSLERLHARLLAQHLQVSESEVHAVSVQVSLTYQMKEWQSLVALGHDEGEWHWRWASFARAETETRRRLALVIGGLPADSKASKLAAHFLKVHDQMGADYR